MYIAVEGVIGVGKTTLARMLQPIFSTQLLLEVVEENPFLSSFYADRARYAFQVQIFFLLSRYRQQRDALAKVTAGEGLISDYTFAKDQLFARVNLEGDELATYDQLHQALAEKIPAPDLIVYLRAPTEVLLQRIALRDRPYERDMQRDYLDTLRRAYDRFLLADSDLTVLSVDASEIDFVRNTADFDNIVARVRAALSGTYQPALPLEAVATPNNPGESL